MRLYEQPVRHENADYSYRVVEKYDPRKNENYYTLQQFGYWGWNDVGGRFYSIADARAEADMRLKCDKANKEYTVVWSKK